MSSGKTLLLAVLAAATAASLATGSAARAAATFTCPLTAPRVSAAVGLPMVRVTRGRLPAFVLKGGCDFVDREAAVGSGYEHEHSHRILIEVTLSPISVSAVRSLYKAGTHPEGAFQVDVPGLRAGDFCWWDPGRMLSATGHYPYPSVLLAFDAGAGRSWGIAILLHRAPYGPKPLAFMALHVRALRSWPRA